MRKCVGDTEAEQVLPRLPPVSGLPGPTSPVSQTKHHFSAASLGVNIQLAMANPGHTGPMQGRPTQGNNQVN